MTREKDKKSKTSWGENIRVIIYALLIAFFIRTVAFQPFNIPSGSMIPTLLVGDYLFVSKYSYGYSRYSLPFGLKLFNGRLFSNQPKRGDVAVFRQPPSNRDDFIKRIVGLPGDKIQMIGGVLYINGSPTKKKRIEDASFTDWRGREISIPQYAETLDNGVSYIVSESMGNAGPVDNTQEFIVPKNHYFAMGDNRDNSNDSRSWLYIPSENLVGRAEIIFFSTDGSSGWLKPWLWLDSTRFERIFSSID
ncbi:MAG: signal peptidase I [Alphaproteobacteria bacterium]|jgi:signal peptidase I|nr:signal peptidase I [Alphaproteobacteria bacterium]PPR13212.1 MAG: Signal peptidase I [Alphaproteobacteria bacterium MarineAlpha12_Bin1]|tara:strand:+ start:3885 stop:4631 length:747 start_codon:yes stop_codon:yes gene_type:complete